MFLRIGRLGTLQNREVFGFLGLLKPYQFSLPNLGEDETQFDEDLFQNGLVQPPNRKHQLTKRWFIPNKYPTILYCIWDWLLKVNHPKGPFPMNQTKRLGSARWVPLSAIWPRRVKSSGRDAVGPRGGGRPVPKDRLPGPWNEHTARTQMGPLVLIGRGRLVLGGLTFKK